MYTCIKGYKIDKAGWVQFNTCPRKYGDRQTNIRVLKGGKIRFHRTVSFFLSPEYRQEVEEFLAAFGINFYKVKRGATKTFSVYA